MKILVATKETQGKRDSDFSWVDEGELVYFGGGPCDRDKEDIDGNCGCQRALISLKTFKATTTFKIIQSDLRPRDILQAIKDAHKACGLAGSMTEKDYREEAEDLIMLAQKFEVGSILEKRGNFIKTRMIKDQQIAEVKNI